MFMGSGRPRNKGSGCNPQRFARVPVSYAFKKQVIEFYNEPNSLSDTVAKFYPSLPLEKKRSKKQQILKWVRQKDVILVKCRTGRSQQRNARELGAGTVLTSQEEEELVRWINVLRSDGMPISAQMLRLQALQVLKRREGDCPTFTASWTWRRSFMARNKLTLRARTRQGQVTPADITQIANAFAIEVRKRMVELNVTRVYNADQTGVFFEYLPKETVWKKGPWTVWVKCSGKDKERVTAMSLADSEVTKHEPWLVFKTKPA